MKNGKDRNSDFCEETFFPFSEKKWKTKTENPGFHLQPENVDSLKSESIFMFSLFIIKDENSAVAPVTGRGGGVALKPGTKKNFIDPDVEMSGQMFSSV